MVAANSLVNFLSICLLFLQRFLTSAKQPTHACAMTKQTVKTAGLLFSHC